MIYANRFWNDELNLPYSSSLPFNRTSQILIGQYYAATPGCAKISNVKISLEYFNANYVIDFMTDTSGN